MKGGRQGSTEVTPATSFENIKRTCHGDKHRRECPTGSSVSESGAQKRDECWSERYEGLRGPPNHGRGCAGKSQAGRSVKKIQTGAREVGGGSFRVGK